MTDLYTKALDFATKAHGDQKRKYTNEPYIAHPISVAEIVRKAGGSEEMIIAALLHDVVEDTEVCLFDVRKEFGTPVRNLVSDLTDIYTPEAFPTLNRKERKRFECARISIIPNEAKTIKLADLIDNTSSIVEHDPSFAKTYLKEKEEMLKVLIGGDENLLNRAWEVLWQAKKKLEVNES